MALSPVEQRRIASLEAKIAALERLTRPASGIGQGSSTLFGSLNIRSTQLGFAAELTSTFNSTTGYNWKRLALDTTGSITLTNPAIQLTGNRAYSIDGSTTLASGTKGWLEPSPESSGYLFTTASSASAGFFARLTTSSGGNWNFYKLKLSSGSYTDDGAEVTGYNAVPLTIDGTNLCNPVAGLRVWMIPSQQAGKYEFLPIGMADGTHPGLISLTTQTMGDGDKHFQQDVVIDQTLEVNADVIAGADVSGYGLPIFTVWATDGNGDDYSIIRVHQSTTNSVLLFGQDTRRPLNIYGWGGGVGFRATNIASLIGEGTTIVPATFQVYSVDYGSGDVRPQFSFSNGNNTREVLVQINVLHPGATPAVAAFDVQHAISCQAQYWCQGDEGLTEDVAIPGADGNTYTLHFTGGIYVGYDVETTCGGELTGFAAGTELIRFRNPKPLNLTPTAKTAIVTAATGRRGRELLDVSGPLLRSYAARLGADFVTLTKRHPSYALSVKWGIRRVLEHYERIVFLDADILVPTDAPNLFDLCRVSNIGASDELPWLTMANPKVLDEYQWVRTGQGKQRVPCSQYFNSGVIVASRYHADLFGPPPGPAPVHHCLEQHWWNARLYDTATPVTVLPREANWQWWTDREFKVAPPNAMLHFSGIKSHTSRMRYMRHFAAKLSS